MIFFISTPKGGRILLVLNIQKGIQLPHITSFQHVNLKSNYDKLDCVLKAEDGREVNSNSLYPRLITKVLKIMQFSQSASKIF